MAGMAQLACGQTVDRVAAREQPAPVTAREVERNGRSEITRPIQADLAIQSPAGGFFVL